MSHRHDAGPVGLVVLAVEVRLRLEVQVAATVAVALVVGGAHPHHRAGGVDVVHVVGAVVEPDHHGADVRRVAGGHEPLVFVARALVVAVEAEQVRGAEVGDVLAGGPLAVDVARVEPGVGLRHLGVVPPEAERVADVDRDADHRVGRGAPDHREGVVEVVIVVDEARGLRARADGGGRVAEAVAVLVRVPDGLLALGAVAGVGRVGGVGGVLDLAGVLVRGRGVDRVEPVVDGRTALRDVVDGAGGGEEGEGNEQGTVHGVSGGDHGLGLEIPGCGRSETFASLLAQSGWYSCEILTKYYSRKMRFCQSLNTEKCLRNAKRPADDPFPVVGWNVEPSARYS